MQKRTEESEGTRIMKKVVTLLLVTIMVVAVCACTLFHQHTWKDATCTEPKTCTGCGETEGEALGHTWKDATCTEPKTCVVCGATEGEALGHTWADATCTGPKTCTVCGATEGEALGHTWKDATCTEPKTCTVCGATEGEALGHTWKDASCTEPKTCTVCGATEGEALGHSWADATCTEPKTCIECGATEGEALGHFWNEATCTEPKTCTVCGPTEGEALGHTWTDATCIEPQICTVCGTTEGAALGHTAEWEIIGMDVMAATRSLKQVCAVCGEELGTEEEQMQTFIENAVFCFTPEEFVARLQKAWDEHNRDEWKLTFKYTVNSSKYVKFNYYLDDTWLGWGQFYDLDGSPVKANTVAPIASIKICTPPLDGWEVSALRDLFRKLIGPSACAADPAIENGDTFEDDIFDNLYATGGDALNGLHYTCGLSDEGYYSLVISIADGN